MRLLVISPHADDETLGAGGTLLKCRDKGFDIHWLNVTDVKQEYGFDEDREKTRQDEIASINKEYNFMSFHNLSLCPAKSDRYVFGELIEKFCKVIDYVKPDTLLLPHWNDIHSDHRVVFDVVTACTKSFRKPFIKNILCMEILSETNYAVKNDRFRPNCFVDISQYIDKKIEIMRRYNSELAPSPFPRSETNIRGLASYRGSSCYVNFAEAFQIIKCIT